MATQTPSSRRSAGLVTDLTRSYRENPYMRSTINVVLLQVVFAVVTILAFYAGLLHQKRATEHVIEIRRAAVAAGQTVTPESLTNALEYIENRTLAFALLALIALAALFGYLAARFALNPTRNSLEYQKRFIGNVAHELRTPLSVIRTSTEVALMDDSLSDYSRSTFSGTIEELDRISEIINNLLSFDTLLRPGRIRMSPVQLSEVLALVAKRHTELAKTRGIQLSFSSDCDDEHSYVLGNEVALTQVFTNLVKNALNYTPQHDGRSVDVTLREKDDTLQVTVADTGIGIAQKDLYHIFEPFYRGDTARDRTVSGGTSGLGLAIVNDIVRAHRGTIIIRSALNRGTSIEITFPKADTTEYVKDLVSGEDDGEVHVAEV